MALNLEHQTHTKTPLSTHMSYLPGSETGGAHEMTAGLNLHILVILGTDLTQLESGAHLTVQLILLLRGGKNETTISFQCLNSE